MFGIICSLRVEESKNCPMLFQGLTPLPLLIVPGYEASEDKAYKEPLLTHPDEPPPVSVMLAEPAPPAPVAPDALEGSEPAYTEYSEPGQPGRTGGLFTESQSVYYRSEKTFRGKTNRLWSHWWAGFI